MEAVAWLARERGAPLQGLLVDDGRYWPSSSEQFEEHTEALRRLQKEQSRSWARAEGAL